MILMTYGAEQVNHGSVATKITASMAAVAKAWPA
jgi:hypothetical protein